MKLTKAQLKCQKELQDLLNSKSKFTYEETERIYNEFNEGFIGDVTLNSAYFTPLGLAYDFNLMCCWNSGTVVDMCAGFGVLSWAAQVRDNYNHDIKKIICIERDPRYIEIGKKLVQSNDHCEVIWIQGDMFDQELWKKIIAEHGPLSCIYSNPPFGKVSKTDCDRSWLKYKGAELDMAAIEIAIRFSNHQAFILPQGSCTFRCSGRHGGHDHCENKKVDKLKKDTGLQFYMSWGSIETVGDHYGSFKNTPTTVECLYLSDVVKPEGF